MFYIIWKCLAVPMKTLFSPTSFTGYMPLTEALLTSLFTTFQSKERDFGQIGTIVAPSSVILTTLMGWWVRLQCLRSDSEGLLWIFHFIGISVVWRFLKMFPCPQGFPPFASKTNNSIYYGKRIETRTSHMLNMCFITELCTLRPRN
jgi:hypothetical protein